VGLPHPRRRMTGQRRRAAGVSGKAGAVYEDPGCAR